MAEAAARETPYFLELDLENRLRVALMVGHPRGDVYVSSTNEFGNPGDLSVLVLRAAGIHPQDLPGLFKAPVTLVQGDRPVLVVQTVGGEPTRDLLKRNLARGLESLDHVDGHSLYLPLLGTGAGHLSPIASAKVMLEVLGKWRARTFREVFLAAPDEATAAQIAEVWGPNTLRRGASGELVKTIQRWLALPADGIYGPATEGAVQAFQAEHQLPETGFVDPQTWGALQERFAADERVSGTEPSPGAKEGSQWENEALSLATAFADLRQHPEGADAGLVLLAIWALESEMFERFLKMAGMPGSDGARPFFRGLRHYGLEEVPPTPEGGWRSVIPTPRLNAEMQRLLRLRSSIGVGKWGPSPVLVSLLFANPRRGGPASVTSLLAAMGMSPARVRRAVKEQSGDLFEDRSVARRFEELFVESSPRLEMRSAYTNDHASGKDELDIEDSVDALADVIAAAARTPPLAVGLFGAWGSGKSFFIKQLRARLERLAECATKARQSGEATAYCARFVHVDFNAWQYTDGNLWANLVHRIFEELSETLFGRPQDLQEADFEKQRQTLFAKLGLAREQLAENQQLQVAAKETARGIENRRLELVARRDAAAAKLVTPSSTDVLDRVLALPQTQALVQTFQQAWSGQGGADVVTQLRDAREQLGSFGGRVQEAWRRWYRASPGYLVLVGLALLIALFGPVLVEHLVEHLKVSTGQWLTGVLAVVGTAVPAVTKYLNQARQALDAVEKAEASVQRGLAKEQERLQAEQAAAQAELSEANLQILRIEEEERKIGRQVQELELQISRISAGYRMREFIRERSAGDDYRRHLGILSTIRADFENLGALLDTVQKEVKKEVPVERVILYVDDLDRCPADRVVEVLQAVHLLLDFPLFVAVVAVDSRWLLRSLSAHYAPQLAAGQGNGVKDRERTIWASTPQSFLEKIFQIPLTLPPMESSGYQRLVRSLLPIDDAATSAASERSSAKPEAPPLDEKAAPRRESEPDSPRRESVASAVQSGPPSRPVVVQSAPPPANSNANTSAKAGSGQAVQAHAEGSAPGRAAINPNPVALQVSRHERDFLERIGELVSTPRSVKRLVNLYWLTRASLREHELEEFTGTAESPGSHRLHLVLLGAMVGYPSVTNAFFEAVLESDDGDLMALIDRLRPVARGTEFENEFDRSLIDADAQVWSAFCQSLTNILTREGLPRSFASYHEAIRKVSRFSFQTGEDRPARKRVVAGTAAPD